MWPTGFNPTSSVSVVSQERQKVWHLIDDLSIIGICVAERKVGIQLLEGVLQNLISS